MAVTARPRLLLPALVAAVAMGMSGAPATAVESIPDEEAFEVTASSSSGAIVGDVDGDATRELVVLVPWRTNPAQMAVEVVVMQNGQPASRGQGLLQRATAPDDTFAGNNPDESALLPLGVHEPARLLALRVNGRERVLVATMQGATNDPGIERSCCLTLWWLSLERNGATSLELIQDTAASAAWIVAADMDADGTDELAVVETPDPVLPAASRIRVLRWNGTDFTILTAEAGEGLIKGPLTVLGDSDGIPGDEVGYTAVPGSFDQVEPTLHRFALVDGRLRVEWTLLPEAGTVLGMPGPDGGSIVLVARGSAYELHWPAGTPGANVESVSRGGTPLGVLGSGEDARVLVVRGGQVAALALPLADPQTISAGPAASWFAASSWAPYTGPVPGGDVDGRPAFVFGGRLIRAAERSGTAVELRDIAVLPGRVPIGFFGERNRWAALATAVSFPVDRRGGALMAVGARAFGGLSITPASVLLEPEADGGLLTPPIEGALLDGGDRRPGLLTSGAVRATIRAPDGSSVAVVGQTGGPREAKIGLSGQAVVSLVEDDPSATTDERLTVRLLVSTPGGHAYGAIWEVRVLRRPPTLKAAVPVAPLSFSVPLTGRTAPGARLVVDGTPVPVAPDGSFSAEVGAGLWPRAVRIEATDRIGNASQLTLEVVGLVDYRRLPWIPIVAAMTLLAGALLYVRVPKPKARHASADPDEGVLEEIQ